MSCRSPARRCFRSWWRSDRQAEHLPTPGQAELHVGLSVLVVSIASPSTQARKKASSLRRWVLLVSPADAAAKVGGLKMKSGESADPVARRLTGRHLVRATDQLLMPRAS